MGLGDKIKDAYASMKKVSRQKEVEVSNASYFKFMQEAGVEIKRLSAEQKAEVDAIWKKYKKGAGYSYGTHELYYSATGEFDATIVPEDLFFCTIFSSFNDEEIGKAYSDKNYFELVETGIRFPEAICRCIGGYYYDKDYKLLTKPEADKLLAEQLESLGAFVAKPSKVSGRGAGVELFKKGEIVTTDSLAEIYDNDYIIQKKFIQHKAMAALNEDSVNVIRVNTFFVGDEPEVEMCTIRSGAVGSIHDHSTTDKRNVIMGVTKDGRIKDFGFKPTGEKTEVADNGFKFGGMEIPGFEEMCQMCIEGHKRLPDFRFIGWDMVIDEDGHPVAMEYNVRRPGILFYQWCNGGMLGQAKDEILRKLRAVGVEK